MSEIERAIQEFEDNAYHPSMKPKISDESKAVAIRVLRAELDREKNPLTCDGCRSYELRYTMAQPCVDCFRSKSDRYEPKGDAT